MSTIMTQIDEAVSYIRTQTSFEPEVGIVLGTGLGGLADEIQPVAEISYDQIPNFVVSTVESHEGKLIFGTLGGRNVVAMQGRFHFYEGYTMQQIVFPIRVMKYLGVHSLVISNACGGMNPIYSKGDLMIMNDHINLLGDNPLIGVNEEKLGPRFPDMSEPYTQKLIALAEKIALEEKIMVQKGVYVAVAGPCLETRAEYRFLRGIGADVVGMSTVPEVIAARHMDLQVFGLSVITDECFPDALEPVDVQDIIATAMAAQPNLTRLMKCLIEQM